MKNIFLVIAVSISAIAAGIGAAYLVSNQVENYQGNTRLLNGERVFQEENWRMNRIPQNRGGMYGPGRMFDDRRFFNQTLNTGERITIEQALNTVNEVVDKMDENLVVSEIMAFDKNFYAAVKENDTGKGAFELLVDPYSGSVSYEPGPNMMWNLKYGHMGSSSAANENNQITLEQAKEYAQNALDNQVSGAEIEGHGLSFYGYYTFDYQIDGKISGMLSVNGNTGKVWFHSWHGKFLEELEVK